MNEEKLALVALVVPLVFILVALGVMSASWTFQNFGTVKSVGVQLYSDQQLTTPLTSIDWGLLDVGSSTQRIVYVLNNGTATETLSMVVANWNPVNAGQYMSLTWGSEGYPILPNEYAIATLTLTVFSNITGIQDFSVDITITGSG